MLQVFRLLFSLRKAWLGSIEVISSQLLADLQDYPSELSAMIHRIVIYTGDGMEEKCE